MKKAPEQSLLKNRFSQDEAAHLVQSASSTATSKAFGNPN
jgi:hypothetical protein